MNNVKREPEYPVELESQFILRLPEEPAKVLRNILTTGENLKNRFTIQIDNDMRHGQVRLDHRLMHAKIFDLPTIVECLKTIDRKSFYKSADICQLMICKDEPDLPFNEEETPLKNKKKDPYKVDKKFLWPHGITPPTKNVRKRRFRKTLKKKYVETPEIEKEVKRLLRADNEAVSFTWAVIKEEDEPHVRSHSSTPAVDKKSEKKQKTECTLKRAETIKKPINTANPGSSNVLDIFGGAVSDSDLEDENINVELEESHLSLYDTHMSDNSFRGLTDMQNKDVLVPLEINAQIFDYPQQVIDPKMVEITELRPPNASTSVADIAKNVDFSGEDDSDPYFCRNMSKNDITLRLQQIRTEIEEIQQRRQRTMHEIVGMGNLALRQRFQDILHTMNQDILYKEMEYKGLLSIQNIEDM